MSYLTEASSTAEGRVDVLCRIVQSEEQDDNYNVYVRHTEDVLNPVVKALHENSILREVVRNLWHTQKYNQEYMAFLMGSYTREEFLPVAERYARAFQVYSPATLATACHVVHNVLNESLSSADFSALLNAEPSEIDKNLQLTSGLLPELEEGNSGNQE